MSVKNRLKKYIKHIGITTKSFEESIEAANGYVNNISKSIGIDKFQRIIEKYANLNVEWLLTGKGEMIKNETTTANIEAKVPQVITVNSNNEDNIVFVPVKAQAGYLNGYDDPTFIKNLPVYRLPKLNNGIFRMFQVEGFSMHPTLPQDSIVACQFVENWKNDIKDNRIYVVVTPEYGIVIKRCLNRIEKYNNLFLKSDNRREYPSYAVDISAIKEVWEVKLAMVHNLPDPVELHDKVYDLEAELLQIKHILSSKNIHKLQ